MSNVTPQEVMNQLQAPNKVSCWTCGQVDNNPTFLESWTLDQFRKPCMTGALGPLKHKLWICPQANCTKKFDLFVLE